MEYININILTYRGIMKRIRKTSGITLVELMLTVFILSVGIGGVLLLLVNSMISTDYAWDVTLAVSHAESVLEEMQLQESLDDITSINWQEWVEFQEFSTLDNEQFEIVFKDVEEDPLDISVKVYWDSKERNNNIQLSTKITK